MGKYCNSIRVITAVTLVGITTTFDGKFGHCSSVQRRTEKIVLLVTPLIESEAKTAENSSNRALGTRRSRGFYTYIGWGVLY